jgi:hypothetical protein
MKFIPRLFLCILSSGIPWVPSPPRADRTRLFDCVSVAILLSIKVACDHVENLSGVSELLRLQIREHGHSMNGRGRS